MRGLNKKGIIEDWIWLFFYIPLTFVVAILLFLSPKQHQEALANTYGMDNVVIFWGVMNHIDNVDLASQRSQHLRMNLNVTNADLQELLVSPFHDVGIRFALPEAPCNNTTCSGGALQCEYNSDAIKKPRETIPPCVIECDCAYERLEPLKHVLDKVDSFQRNLTVWRTDKNKTESIGITAFFEVGYEHE